MWTTTQLHRLLNLYSFQKLRSHFALEKNKKDDCIQTIIADRAESDIEDFAYRYHATTKHHLHLFDFPGIALKELPDDPLSEARLIKKSQMSDSHIWFYLLEFKYAVFVRDPLEILELSFLWPISIKCQHEQLQLRFTIMKKQMATYLGGRKVIKVTKEMNESKLQAQILGNFDLPNVRPLDLNKGVKELWAKGVIDAPAVQWKKSRAVTRQVMDADFLVRKDDPSLYSQLIDKPLFKTSFQWLDNTDGMSVSHFTVDAAKGVVSFNTYSDLAKGADDVVQAILERN